MVKSMFAAIAGMRTHQQKLDVIGNNIANVNTMGFKAGRMTFRESFYQTVQASSAGNDAVGGYGGANPSQIGYGSKVGTIDLMFSTGAPKPTDKQTDCMIDGNGFFLVGPRYDDVTNATDGTDAAANGTLSRLKLTRVGDFSVDGNGYLVDGDKNIVYGFYGTTDGSPILGNADFVPVVANLKPIRIPIKNGTERYNLGSIRVDDKGNLIGVDKDDEQIVTVARLAVCNVPNPNALEKSQGPYYKIVNNTGKCRAFSPGTGSTGLLMSSCLESANVDLANEFSEMITTQRGFQANTRIITVTDEMLQELVNLKR